MKESTNFPKVVNIQEKLGLFNDYWNPRVVGRLNDYEVKVVKLKGKFVWHKHDEVDEMFWVIKGHLIIHLRDQDLSIDEGEFIIIPKQMEHKPEAPEETHVILIETAGTLNTGNVRSEKTVGKLKEI